MVITRTIVSKGRCYMEKENWYSCPICGNPHMLKYGSDTVVVNFPAFCKKCKNESIVTIEPKSRIS